MHGVTHIPTENLCYFVTTATAGRRKLFLDAENCRILANVIQNVRRRDGFLLGGFVIMPDHLHIALLPTSTPLSGVIKEIKRGSARLINARAGTSGSVWQPDYWERGIEREDELKRKVEYMLANPFRASLVTNGGVYPWGTGNPAFPTDLELILGG